MQSESLHEHSDIKLCLSSTNEDLVALEDGCLKRNSSSVNFYDSCHCSQEVSIVFLQNIRILALKQTSLQLVVTVFLSWQVQKNDTKESINEFAGGGTRIQSASCLPGTMCYVIKDLKLLYYAVNINKGLGALKVLSCRTYPVVDELLEEDEKTAHDTVHTVLQPPPNRPKTKSCQSPLRNLLSPVNTNTCRLQIEDISSKENVLSALVESQNPTTPFVVTREKFQDFDTPLDKFSARTSNFKV